MVLDYLQESHHQRSSLFHIHIDKCLTSQTFGEVEGHTTETTATDA